MQEEHLTLLQKQLISLKDARPREPDDEYDAKKAEIERQIAEIEQVLLSTRAGGRDVGGAAAAESPGGGTLEFPCSRQRRPLDHTRRRRAAAREKLRSVLETVAENGFTEPLSPFRDPLFDHCAKTVADRESTNTYTLSTLRRRAQASTQKTRQAIVHLGHNMRWPLSPTHALQSPKQHTDPRCQRQQA